MHHSIKTIHGQWLLGLALFLVFPAAASAGTLTNGMPASDALGQYDDNLTSPSAIFTKGAANDGPNKLGLNGPSPVAFDGTHHRLFVGDFSNNRVLVYNLNSDNTLADHIPDYVLGQSNFYSSTAATTQSGMRGPYNLAYDAGNDRLFVGEWYNRRVLVYSTSTLTNGMNATYVLGQSSFTSSGATTTQSGTSNVHGVSYDSVHNRLFVTDEVNHRVLVFDTTALATGMNATYVLGQTNFTTATVATTRSKFNNPTDVTYDANHDRIFVCDYVNNRVMVFSGANLATGMSGSYVLGQSSFTASASATTQAGMSTPVYAFYDTVHDRLFVSDGGNRILAYSGASLTTGMNAAKVLGQTSFTASTAATTQSGLSGPSGLAFDSGNNVLYAADATNNRVLLYNLTTFSNGQNASDALGQYDDSLTNPQPIYTKGAIQNGPNKLGIANAFDVAVDSVHHRLFVTDFGNNRVLVYNLNSDGTLPDRIPDYVLGQSNFYTKTATTTQTGMNTPDGVVYDSVHDRLFVADKGNNRILVFDASALSTGMAASYVLGQSTFTTGSSGLTAATLHNPQGLAYDSNHNRIFVADDANKRVMVFSGSTLANGMSGAYVLGQPNFATAGSTTSQSLIGNSVTGVMYDTIHDRLYVVTWESRTLVFSGASLSNGMNAAHVLGQPNFTSNSPGVSATTENFGHGITCDATCTNVFMVDASNNRVLVYNVSTLSNGMAASYVLGQPNFTTSTSGVTQSSMLGPIAAVYDSTTSTLYVEDTGNSRLLLFDLSPSSSTLAISPTSGTIGSVLTITLTDKSLNTDAASEQTATVSDGQENITLTETANNSGVFTGTIPTAYGKPTGNSGTFELDDGGTCSTAGTITFTNTQTPADTSTATVALSVPNCTPVNSATTTTSSGGGGGGGGRSVSVSIPTTTPFSNTTTTTATLTSSTPTTGNTVIDGTIKRLNQRIAKMLAVNQKSVFAKAIQRRIAELAARVKH